MDQLEKMIEDFQKQILDLPKSSEKEESDFSSLENDLQNKLVQKAKEELQIEITKAKIKGLKTSLM